MSPPPDSATICYPEQASRIAPWKRKDGRFAVDVGEREFLQRVQSSDGFWKSVNGLSKATGMEVDTLEGFAQDICRSVWSEVDAVMSSEGPVAAARDEVKSLKKKITECNLSAMKQMLASKAETRNMGELGDDTITFHEPLQYLDKEAKDLVMQIVCDKVRQLEGNTAPPSLVQALVQHAEAKANPGESASMEELKEAKAQLEDARVELRKARIRMQEAEEVARKFEARLQVAEARTKMFEQELAQTKTVLASTEQKLQEAECALGALRAEHAKLQETCTQQKEQIERQGRELAYEKSCKEKLQKEVERLQVFVARAEQLERDLKALQVKYDELQTEAKTMREELARRNNTRTSGTQTTLTGSKLDEQAAEKSKMKLMLEELQTKLKELMTAYRRKFGDAATKIADGLGLKELLKEETVFQRLYDDAMDRVDRLEKLRTKVKKERQGLSQYSERGSPRGFASELGENPELSVLEAVEEHQPTPGMRQLLEDKEAACSRQRSMFTSPLQYEQGYPSQRYDQSCGSDSRAVWKRLEKISQSPVKMNSSTSLPSLSKPEHQMSVLTLNLNGGRKGSKKLF
jgi:chromosome segregation ATPase